MKLLQFVQLGLITLFVQHACIQATINRVIPNMFYQVSGCEGKDLLVECPVGYYIEIAEGRYGRTSGTECIPDGEDPVPEDKLSCAGTSVFDIPSVTACNGLETCNLKVSVEDLELEKEPCASSSFSKYLNVSFTCIKPIVESYVCEGETIIMSCPNGEVLQIVDVLYGRTDKERCTENAEKGDTENTECYSPDAGWKVTDLCNHKPYCEVAASSTMFGDPCEGTSKFLHVVYQCASCNNEEGDDEKCDGYALRGECEMNPSWMMASCRKSCWRCDTNAMCNDMSDFMECTKWASIGECHNNEKWMKENCQYSCNRCYESMAQAQAVNDGWQEQQDQQEVPEQENDDGQEEEQEEQEEQEEKVEIHKRDTRNHSEESEESDGPPLKKYYSLIALGGTVFIMTSMIIYLSLRPKQEKGFKKSA